MTARPETGQVVIFQPAGKAPLVRDTQPPDPPSMDPRVDTLVDEMKDVKAVLTRMEPLLIRIDERTNHLAAKAELATKATRGTVWAMGFTVAGLFVAALTAGAVYMPHLATLLRRALP